MDGVTQRHHRRTFRGGSDPHGSGPFLHVRTRGAGGAAYVPDLPAAQEWMLYPASPAGARLQAQAELDVNAASRLACRCAPSSGVR